MSKKFPGNELEEEIFFQQVFINFKKIKPLYKSLIGLAVIKLFIRFSNVLKII